MSELNETPKYDLDKIRFGTDRPTFSKAVDLYESGRVTDFREEISSYSALVFGTKPYRVFVEARHYDLGHCDCYLGQKNILCKHMVALAIMVVAQGRALTALEKRAVESPTSSGRLGKLSDVEFNARKKEITAALRYIKAYEGPSRTWFRYQDSLREGCRRLAALISELPVSLLTAQLIIKVLLRLDKKLSHGGVDDSDGTVGNFMQEVVSVLDAYTKFDPQCIEVLRTLQGRNTCFGWEEPLLKLLDGYEN